MRSKGWRLPLFLSAIALFSQAWLLPAPVRDAATCQWASGFAMHYPVWHLVFTPFCGIADSLTVQSVYQAKIVLIWVLALFFFIGGLRRGLACTGLFVLFLAWGGLVPRPMGRLVASDPDTVLVDFHSHTQLSHDGRPSFTPQANMLWHHAQGYDAAFITDHNQTGAAERAQEISRSDWERTGYRSLRGEEVSLKKTHLVILGNHERVDNVPYDSDFAKIPIFVADMHKSGYPVIASLPEFWFYHWGAGVDDFVRWGMDGFELVNSAPKAMDFPLQKRLEIVDLCRRHNLFMTGISDNHGYGYATAAWNAMKIPGWRQMGPDALETAVLSTLQTKRFEAVQVLERARFIPQNPWQLAISPPMTAWLYWRSLQPLQAVSWVAWIWIAWLAIPPRRRKSK